MGGWHEPVPGERVQATRMDEESGEEYLAEAEFLRSETREAPGWRPAPVAVVRFDDGEEGEALLDFAVWVQDPEGQWYSRAEERMRG